jgi:hypothetical protein
MQRSTQEAIKLPPSIIAGKKKKEIENPRNAPINTKVMSHPSLSRQPENPGTDQREREMGQEHGGRNSFPRTSSSAGMMNISLQFHWTACALSKLIKC